MTSVAQPAGTVTLVFTDIEGSTRLLEELGTDAYREALARHREFVRAAYVGHGGYEVDYEGDSFFYAFASAQAAVDAVSEAMADLEDGPIRIRVGIHTGEPGLDPPKYVGMDVHRAARIMSAAHGGQVVLSPSTVSLLEPGSFEFRELGLHRLKDLSSPIPLHQLLVDGLGREFPPLKTLYHSNLPVPATPFVGRMRELEAVTERLTDPAMRVLTLTGPGGTGKTRLALQAAAEAADLFPDGVYWVPLAPLRDPGLLLPTVAQTLGVKERPEEDLAATIAGALLGKRTLLLLDNAEHLLPDLAGTLARLAAACPTMRVLVTSRERLRVAVEVSWPVPPLSATDGEQLFLERADAAGVAIDVAGAEVAELCRRLEELPLAIELAAARTPLFTPTQLLDRLGQRLDLLQGGRDGDPRQQTLRATIAWSHDLLGETEKELFARLSVFAGGCTYESVEEVCEADPDTLQSLLDKSLLGRRESDLGPRYWMLETIREYAAEQLQASGESDSRRRRHTDWHANEIAKRTQALGVQSADAVSWVASERENLRLALRDAVECANVANATMLVAGLRHYWFGHGDFSEGDASTAAVLALSGQPDRDRADILCGAATFRRELGDVAAARALLEEADALYKACGDEGGHATVLGRLGTLIRRDNPQEAIPILEEALALKRLDGDSWTLAGALYDLGGALAEAGEPDRGVQLLNDAREILEESGHTYGLAQATHALGWAAFLQGDYAASVRLTARATELAEEFDDPDTLRACALNTAYALGRLGRLREAARLLAASERLRVTTAAALAPIDTELVRELEATIHETMGGEAEPLFEEGRHLSNDEVARYIRSAAKKEVRVHQTRHSGSPAKR